MNSRVSRQQLMVMSALLMSSLLVGCGKAKEPWETVYPTKGLVKYNGKPLADAVVTLIPQDSEFPDSVRPTATTKEDGTFDVGTYSKADGAPEGKYKVLVLHYPVVGSKDNPHAGPNDLPRKYSSPDSTDLIVEVAGPGTEFSPLELRR